MPVKVSDFIARRLREFHGIDDVFMVTGGGAMHLNDSFGRYMHYICCHHEQACAMAAEGYFRSSGRTAAVNITTGPGGLNCLSSLAGQWTDSIPVVYISGQVKYRTTLDYCRSAGIKNLRQAGDQETDIISIVKPLTKYAVSINRPQDIKYHLDKAVYEAYNGRPGPVWLDIPLDVQSACVDSDKMREFVPEKPVEYASQEDAPENLSGNLSASARVASAAKEAARIISSAARPLIVAGHGIRLAGQQNVFLEFLENCDIPVVTTFNGMDILPSSHKNFCGRIGTVGQRAGNFTLNNADAVLFLGTRNNIRQTGYAWEKFAARAFKIAVDIDSAELRKPFFKPDMPVEADLKYFMPEFVSAMDKMNSGHEQDLPEWLSFCKKLLHKYSFENTPAYHSGTGRINVYHFVNTFSRLQPAGSIMVCGNGSACVCAYQAAEVKPGCRIFWNSGIASMGYDLPAAEGACFARPGIPVICLAGDGSIMMNLQELQTVAHHQLPLKIFVISNGGYSSIRQTQNNFFEGRLTGCGKSSGVSFPDFTAVAKSFGIKPFLMEEPGKMEEQIKEILEWKGPALCEVEAERNYQFSPKSASRIMPDGTIISAPIEDMFPFLDRKEYGENIINGL